MANMAARRVVDRPSTAAGRRRRTFGGVRGGRRAVRGALADLDEPADFGLARTVSGRLAREAEEPALGRPRLFRSARSDRSDSRPAMV
jgi:hypothetical protein